jgi:putative aldouronate transport system substrate-binding protein
MRQELMRQEGMAMGNQVNVRLTRRGFLGGLATGGAAAILAACGGTEAPVGTPRPAGTTAPAAGATSPTAAGATATPTKAAIPATSVPATRIATTAAPSVAATPTPDGLVRSPIPGVPDLYTKRPSVFNSVPAVPGRGGRVTSLHISFGNPPVPVRNENRYWQELEKRLGVTLEPTITPVGSYQEKLAALTAAGDLPDISLLVLNRAPDQHRVIQQGAWTDLTPYLTGAALQDYPNLAAFPDFYWENVAIKGKIYGVPRPTAIAGGPLMFRQDWADKLGVSQPKNAEEFARLMVAMTKNDPDGNGQADTYGLGAGSGNPYDLGFFEGMFRVPNGWRLNADGTLTAAYETDEYRQAVAYARRLFEAGVYHPDAGTMNTQQAKQLFAAGKFGGYTDGYGAIPGLRLNAQKVTPAADPVGLVPMGHDGGKAVTHNGSGIIGFVAIPAKAGRDPERVRELLRILNYFCAPFGSEEEIFLNYGIEGIHHEVQPDGTRQRNDRGRVERGDLANLTEAPPFIYIGGDDPAAAKRQQELLEGLLAIGIDNPTLNAFSPTYAAKASELDQLYRDRISAIVAGRAPLSAFDQFVQDWRSRGGDQIRKEYEADLRAQ